MAQDLVMTAGGVIMVSSPQLPAPTRVLSRAVDVVNSSRVVLAQKVDVVAASADSVQNLPPDVPQAVLDSAPESATWSPLVSVVTLLLKFCHALKVLSTIRVYCV